MKKTLKYILIFFCTIVPCFYGHAQELKAFGSLGSRGIGAGLKYKNFTLYTRYFYEYVEDWDKFYYYHHPTMGVTYNIVKEKQVKLFTGLEFRNRFYKQKYFFPGTINSNNFFISVPLGLEIAPIKKIQNLSIILETGLELEHYLWLHKGYSWNLNLWRGGIEIRYQLGKRIKI